jgi:hypothetical protein
MKDEAKKIRETWLKQFLNVTVSRHRCRFQSTILSRKVDKKMKNAPIKGVFPSEEPPVMSRTLKPVPDR